LFGVRGDADRPTASSGRSPGIPDHVDIPGGSACAAANGFAFMWARDLQDLVTAFAPRHRVSLGRDRPAGTLLPRAAQAGPPAPDDHRRKAGRTLFPGQRRDRPRFPAQPAGPAGGFRAPRRPYRQGSSWLPVPHTLASFKGVPTAPKGTSFFQSQRRGPTSAARTGSPGGRRGSKYVFRHEARSQVGGRRRAAFRAAIPCPPRQPPAHRHFLDYTAGHAPP